MKKFLVLMVVVLLASPLLAQEANEPPPIIEASHNAVVAFLRLSPEQIEAWDLIYNLHRDAEKPLQESIAAVQGAIDALFEAGEPDPAELGALFIERRDFAEQLQEVHLAYHEDFVAILDDAQARRLGFIARADEVQPIIPAFKLFELIPRR